MEKAVKSIWVLSLSVFCAIFMQGCFTFVTDTVPEDPAYTSLKYHIYPDSIDPVFKGVEAAYVFSEYQKIRADREKAVKMVRSYYGSYLDELYYEKMHVSSVGTVFPDTVSGFLFLFKTHCNYSEIGDNIPYYVFLSEDGVWTLEFASETMSLSAKVVVSGRKMVVKSFSAETVSDKERVTVSSDSDDLMVMRLSENGDFCTLPESGKINVNIDGANSLSDSFAVEFGPAVRIVRGAEVNEYDHLAFY